MTTRRSVLTVCILLGTMSGAPLAGTWPMYQHDAARSGVCDEVLAETLTPAWRFVPARAPRHAWGDPQPKVVEGLLELPRLRFDDAYHAVMDEKRVYFGSSGDGGVHALDAATGRLVWSFYTEAPVRMAPTLGDGCLYAGSDDGRLYCLSLDAGRELWRFDARLGTDVVVGNGRVCSLWPIRTGVILADGVVYFGCGVFPSEGLGLFALDAATGAERWRNTEFTRGGRADISPQGYMAATPERLFMASGRSVPAAFSRRDGSFRFQRGHNWRAVGQFGGTYLLTHGSLYLNGTEQLMGLSGDNGALRWAVDVRRVLFSGERAFLLTDSGLRSVHAASWLRISRERLANRNSLRQATKQVASLEHQIAQFRRRKADPPANLLKQLEAAQKRLLDRTAKRDGFDRQVDAVSDWAVPCGLTDAAVATATHIVVGGDGIVRAHRRTDGKVAWEQAVPARVRGLAVADGRVAVSLSDGSLMCLIQAPPETMRSVAQGGGAPAPATPDWLAPHIPERGFAVTLGIDDLSLLLSLTSTPGLTTYAVIDRGPGVMALRRAIAAAGAQGRVFVLERDGAGVPCPDYVADLIVCGAPALHDGRLTPDELLRILKPCGGTALVRVPATDSGPEDVAGIWSAALHRGLGIAGHPDAGSVTSDGSGILIRRGTLPGAGTWTHQYGTPGNTGSSDDQLVKTPLGVLWFGDPGPGRMPSRHASAAAPLSVNGRLFAQGENVIMAYDAYNGTKLWERDIPGAIRTGLKTRCSNLAADETSVYVVAGGKCLRLDAASGETLATYRAPAPDGRLTASWGEYVAVVDRRLYGTTGGAFVFAVEVATGKLAWSRPANGVMPRTVCLAGGRLFFIDADVSGPEREEAIQRAAEADDDPPPDPAKADVRRVVALDAATGQPAWTAPRYVSDCIGIGSGGGRLTMMASPDTVLLCGQPWNGHFWKEFFAGAFSRRSLIALDAATGRERWSGHKGYRSRPLILGDQVIAEPWAHDLASGRAVVRDNPFTGQQSKWQMARPGHHCGNIVGCPSVLFFRSWSMAYYDLVGDTGTTNFGAQRTGCWINCIPANGLVLMPEASSSCQCAFPLQCTVVMRPRKTDRAWSMYSVEGHTTPVRRLAVNLGAPGDRKTADGALWLAWPRPQRIRLVADFDATVNLGAGGAFAGGLTPVAQIPGDVPEWVLASAGRNVRQVRWPLVGPAEGRAVYTVRLWLSNPGEAACAVTVGIRDDRHTVQVSSGACVATVLRDVSVSGDLRLTLSSPDGAPPVLLNGFEVLRDRVLEPGLDVPDIALSTLDPVATPAIRLGNFLGAPLDCRLRVTMPAGMTCEPADMPLSLSNGARRTVPCTVRLAGEPEVKVHTWQVALVRPDNTVVTTRTARCEFLGARGRTTLIATADAVVNAGKPDSTNGHAPDLFVDGGDQQFGDHSHNIVYMRFDLADLPGRPVKATLRLFVPISGYSHSGDSGVVRTTTPDWGEESVTYRNRPDAGSQIAVLGKVDQNTWVERELALDFEGLTSVNLVLDPRGNDGAMYVSREGPDKPELVVEYVAEE